MIPRIRSVPRVDIPGPGRYMPHMVQPPEITPKPRVLLLTSLYFLMGEVVAALTRLGVPHQLLDLGGKEMDRDLFVDRVREAVAGFRPDFLLTVNHLGVDREGVLLDLLEPDGLPLASWFVDNPFLILPLYPRRHLERTALFTWDADNVEALRGFGFPHVSWLPLGADPERFRPGAPGRDAWNAPVSFVGNSMLAKVAGRLAASDPPPELAARAEEVARAFGASDEPSAARFLRDRFPDLWPLFLGLRSPVRMLAFETYLTWLSTRDYRLSCVRGLLPFEPLIAGDPGWFELLPPGGWRHHPELSYYDDLPGFYPRAAINFNCTSLQMKGAVNQRVFDVPASGAFLLTDRRRQMERLFEPNREMAMYDRPEDVSDQIRRWLDDPAGRARLAEAGRRRVLAEHTYDHRLAALLRTMRRTFGARP
ncbi:MAG: glycosyltransferase [Desulfovibrionaceae bacterium]|jgi:spore maturation protein CgeB|nr:glycosyltransferase [Desulfovibrionaceae bacterium]